MPAVKKARQDVSDDSEDLNLISIVLFDGFRRNKILGRDIKIHCAGDLDEENVLLSFTRYLYSNSRRISTSER